MRSLLIVDDEPTITAVLTCLLREHVDEITVAHDGLEALNLLTQRQFGVVLTDVSMPKMGGVELVKTMRKQGMETPVIFFSGSLDREQGSLHNLSQTTYIEKPCSPQQVIEQTILAFS